MGPNKQNRSDLTYIGPDLDSNWLTAETCVTAGPGVVSSILAQSLAHSHTIVEIDHEIISTAILLPFSDSRRVVVSYRRKYVHEVLA